MVVGDSHQIHQIPMVTINAPINSNSCPNRTYLKNCGVSADVGADTNVHYGQNYAMVRIPQQLLRLHINLLSQDC